MEILKTKNAAEIINSKDGFNSILVVGEEKIGELRRKSWNGERIGKFRNKHGTHVGNDARF